ncbi:hypothetical protein AB0G15_29465 [Streptosporangium sp. NPDC023825]|uniref:hypothetical protein n=1 Tax=Streptosporangium sp. NPDC023825 TaxID=3154909 RepID=UPI003445BBFE
MWRKITLAVAVLLTAAGVAVGAQSVEPPAPEPTDTTDYSDQEADKSAGGEKWPRSVRTEVAVRFLPGNKAEVRVEHVATLKAADPIFIDTRTVDDVGSSPADLFSSVATVTVHVWNSAVRIGTIADYRAPEVTLPVGGAEGTLRLIGYFGLERSSALLDQISVLLGPGQPSKWDGPLLQELDSHSVRFSVTGGAVLGFHNEILPTGQDRQNAVYDQAPDDGIFITMLRDGAEEIGNGAPRPRRGLYPVVFIAIWVVLLVSLWRTMRPAVRGIAIAAMLLTLTSGVLLDGHDSVEKALGAAFLLGVLPIGAVVTARLSRGVRPWSPRDTALSLAGAVALLGVTQMWMDGHIVWWRALAALAALLTVGVFTLRRWGILAASACALLLATEIYAWIWSFEHGYAMRSESAELFQTFVTLVIFGILWAPLSFAVAGIAGTALPYFSTRMLALLSGVAFLSLANFVDPDSRGSSGPLGIPGTNYFTEGFGSLSLVLLLYGTAAFLWSRGGSGTNLTERSVQAAGLTYCVVILTPLVYSEIAVVGLAVAIPVCAWLQWPARTRRAARLAGVSSPVYTRVMRLESQRRMLVAAARILSREAPGKLAAGEITPAEVAERMRGLEPHRSRGGPTHISVGSAAEGSSAGFTPRQNAASALGIGLLVNLPLAGYYLYSLGPDWINEFLAIQLVRELLWVLQPALMAFVFGYFYPALRGRGPFEKAAALFLTTIPIYLVELWGSLITSNIPGALPWFAIRTGNLAVTCLTLGLYWEHRMLQAAGLTRSEARQDLWRQSLAPAATAILIAAITTAVTVTTSASLAVWLPRPR